MKRVLIDQLAPELNSCFSKHCVNPSGLLLISIWFTSRLSCRTKAVFLRLAMQSPPYGPHFLIGPIERPINISRLFSSVSGI